MRPSLTSCGFAEERPHSWLVEDTHLEVEMGLHETEQIVQYSSTVQTRKMGYTIRIHVYLNQTICNSQGYSRA